MNALQANIVNVLTMPSTLGQAGGGGQAIGNANRAGKAKASLAAIEAGPVTQTTGSTPTGQTRRAAGTRNGESLTGGGAGQARLAKALESPGSNEAAQTVLAAGGAFAAIVQQFMGKATGQSAASGTAAQRVKPPPASDAGQSTSAQSSVAGARPRPSGTAGSKVNPAPGEQQAIPASDTASGKPVANQTKPGAMPRQLGSAEREPQAGKAVEAKADAQASKNPATPLPPPTAGGKADAPAIRPESAPVQTVPPTTGDPAQAGRTPADKPKVTEPVKTGPKGDDSSKNLPAPIGAKSATEPKADLSLHGDRSPQTVVVELVAGEGGGGAAKSATPTAMTDTTSPAEARTLVQAGALPEETSVVNQIANYLQTGGLRAGQEIVIRLNPPDLGRVRLSLQVQGKDLCGLVEVDNRRALGELQREAPILVSRLADSGVNLRRMEIVLNDPSQQAGTEGSHSTPRDGQGQAQQQEILTAQPPVMSGSVFEEAASEAVGFARQAVVSDDSVNVWM